MARIIALEVSVQSIQQDQDQQPDVYGRFPCRFPGYPKTFAHHGKLHKDHEAKHNPSVAVTGSDAQILGSTSIHDDEMLFIPKIAYGLWFAHS